MSCANLVVFRADDFTLELTEKYSGGDAEVVLSHENLWQNGVRCFDLVGASVLTVTITGPGRGFVYPCFSRSNGEGYAPQVIPVYKDCYLLDRVRQLYTPFRACVSGKANNFTYIGSLAESQIILKGSWISKTLGNGLYPALLKTEDDSPWAIGSVRIIPWPHSRLRFKHFGKHIHALWSNSPYTDPRVANDEYLSPLSLPAGL